MLWKHVYLVSVVFYPTLLVIATQIRIIVLIGRRRLRRVWEGWEAVVGDRSLRNNVREVYFVDLLVIKDLFWSYLLVNFFLLFLVRFNLHTVHFGWFQFRISFKLPFVLFNTLFLRIVGGESYLHLSTHKKASLKIRKFI